MIKGYIELLYEPDQDTQVWYRAKLPEDVATQAWTYGADSQTQAFFALTEPFMRIPIGYHMRVTNEQREYSLDPREKDIHCIRVEARVFP